jgi:hypothetical protein
MTWSPVARELERRGRLAVLPSLLGITDARPPQWRHCAEAVRAATEGIAEPLVLVGHSGAGPLLPVVAEAPDAEIAALVFVDAFLPPPHGSAELAPPGFMDQLEALATNGVLPPWSSWFGEEGIREHVPDPAVRSALEQEMPRLPLNYFDARVPMPDGWDERPCAYVLFARDTYRTSAADARRRGWPVAEISGAHHLTQVTDPVAVSDALLDLERQVVGTRARG